MESLEVKLTGIIPAQMSTAFWHSGIPTQDNKKTIARFQTDFRVKSKKNCLLNNIIAVEYKKNLSKQKTCKTKNFKLKNEILGIMRKNSRNKKMIDGNISKMSKRH